MPSVLMSGALASLAFAPTLPHLHQAYTNHYQAGNGVKDRGLIVIG